MKWYAENSHVANFSSRYIDDVLEEKAIDDLIGSIMKTADGAHPRAAHTLLKKYAPNILEWENATDESKGDMIADIKRKMTNVLINAFVSTTADRTVTRLMNQM